MNGYCLSASANRMVTSSILVACRSAIGSHSPQGSLPWRCKVALFERGVRPSTIPVITWGTGYYSPSWRFVTACEEVLELQLTFTRERWCDWRKLMSSAFSYTMRSATLSFQVFHTALWSGTTMSRKANTLMSLAGRARPWQTTRHWNVADAASVWNRHFLTDGCPMASRSLPVRMG